MAPSPLPELVIAALVDIPGSCSDQDLIALLTANACRSHAQQWALAVLLASAQVGQAADTLTYVVGPQRAQDLLLQWAGSFELEMPTAAERMEDSFAEARTSLKKDIVEAVGDSCKLKALDLVQQGFIRLPSWTTADFKSLHVSESSDELQDRLAIWFLTGLTQKLAHCFDCCGVLTRMDCLEEALSLPAAVDLALHAGLALREMVTEATSLAEEPSLLRASWSHCTDSGDAGEDFISLVATALDASFRRVEAESPPLLLRPLWRFAAAHRIWLNWSGTAPKVRLRCEDEAAASKRPKAEAISREAKSQKDPRDGVKVKQKASKGKDAQLQDWSRRSLAMLKEMGWSQQGL